MKAYRIYAIEKDGRAHVLATAHTAAEALERLHEVFPEHPRAWVVDQADHDISIYRLTAKADEEQKNA